MMRGERQFLGPEDPTRALAFVEGAQRVTGIEYRNMAMVVKERLSILAGMLTKWGEFPQEEFFVDTGDGPEIIKKPCVYVVSDQGMTFYVNPDGQLLKDNLLGKGSWNPVDLQPCEDLYYTYYGQRAINRMGQLVKEAIAASTPRPLTPPAV